MEERLVELFTSYEDIAIIISIIINIGISVLGVFPSVFITAANLIVFGFFEGSIISFIGEALGSIISFWLYRKGFKKFAGNHLSKHNLTKGLVEAEGMRAFTLILSLRLFPFVPSGLVTFIASIGEVNIITFAFASSIGKVPAILLEAYSVYHVTQWTTEGKIILTVISIVGLLFFIKNKMFKKIRVS